MFTTALILGFAGSLHCLGMCSPLVIAATSVRPPFFLNRLIYNGGRILTYGILGATVNTLGYIFPVSGFGDILSIVLGCVLITLGLAGVTHIRIPFVSNAMSQFSIFLKSTFSRFLQKKSIGAFAGMGMINGLLPCGLTYIALAYCITVPGQADAFMFMLLFGAGTLPVMFGLSSVVQKALTYFKFNFRKATTLALIGIGVMLVIRSLPHLENTVHPVSANGITICR